MDLFKIKNFIIIGGLLCVFLWIRFYDDLDAYDSGKFTYETVGEFGHTLADAHGYFLKANGFWDSEDYIRKIEDEMYVEVEKAVKKKTFYIDGVGSSLAVLKQSTRYKDIAEDWDKQRQEHSDYIKSQSEKKIASNPPYVGMSSNYISKTAWGPPTRTSNSVYNHERGVYSYYRDYYDGYSRKVKAVTVSDRKVIKVSDH